MKSLRVVFFGTPLIAVPTLETLIAGPHEVVGVVSQPDRARGRGRKLSPSPVSTVALREDLSLLRPEKVGDPEDIETLRALEPDLGVVVAFGQFLPKPIRELPRCGYLINAHASLLPKYRGAAPIARVILEGAPETGISVMRIEREMDAGPVALVSRTPIGASENTEELSVRLAQIAATAIAECVDRIARDEIEWTEQDASQASFAAKIEKADSQLDLREAARAIVRRIHAVSPKPGGAVRLIGGDGDGDGILLRISRAEMGPFESASAPTPGTIDRTSEDDPLRVATGDGWLIPRWLQRPGGKPLAIADFLRGFEIPDRAHLALPIDGESENP